MKKLILSLLLSLGLTGNSYSELSINAEVANNALRCSALFYMQTAREEMSEKGGKYGNIYKHIYGEFDYYITGKGLTNGELINARADALVVVVLEYENESNDDFGIAKEYRNCAYWLEDIGEHLNSYEDDYSNESEIWLSIPVKSSKNEYELDIEVWANQVKFGYEIWLQAGAPTNLLADQMLLLEESLNSKID